MQSQVDPNELNNADANRVFWDVVATSSFYKQFIASPRVTRLYQQVTSTILACAEFEADTTTLLDFACGPGAFSTALASYCKTVIGVDISQNMVDSYNSQMQTLGIKNARAICTELRPNNRLLAGRKFDVILCAQAYKLIEDNVSITRVLKSYLKPNGVLLVVDVVYGKDNMQLLADVRSIVGDLGEPPSRPKNLSCHTGGYSEDEMRNIFQSAGLIDFSFEEAFETRRDEARFGLFLASGVLPA